MASQLAKERAALTYEILQRRKKKKEELIKEIELRRSEQLDSQNLGYSIKRGQQAASVHIFNNIQRVKRLNRK